ncbi:hypothetical protein [Xanthomonas cannabis]|uniref:hypothetical protein n=1 Tax=Xanthomonas cannabis TaxID=1885674 RepID=UPI0033B56536
MRWIARVFASAVARRLAYALVAIALAWCGIGRAEAQTLQCGSATDYSCDQGRASTACQTYDPTRDHPAGTFFGVTRRNCILIQESQTRGYYILNYWGKNAQGIEEGVYRQGNFYYGKACDKRADYNGPFPSVYGSPRNGSVNCFDGCQIAYYDNGDGTFNGKYTSVPAVCKPDDLDDDSGCQAKFGSGYHYNAALGVCEPTPPEKCPEGQAKDAKGNCKPNACPEGMTLGQDGTCKPSENECPAGTIKSPAGGCLPGDGHCAKGEVRGKDGTCKRDGDGDGEPDEGEEDGTAKENFSGGDDCKSPPACSGSLIMCGQARIQWRIDCNTRKNRNVEGGSCAAAPVCTGEKCDAVEYSQLLMQWRSACAAEKLLGKGDGSGNGQPDWTKVSGDGTGGAGADPDKPHRTVALGVGMLDSGGFLGGGGACPKFGSVSLGKYGSVDLDQWDWICRFFAAVRMVFIALGAFIAFTILGGKSIF